MIRRSDPFDAETIITSGIKGNTRYVQEAECRGRPTRFLQPIVV
jgi:hypothetical protein